MLRLGIDIGSTTAKAVVLDDEGAVRFSAYRRHHAETLVTLQRILRDGLAALGDAPVRLMVTGSAGMGVGEAFGLPFVQEVIASAEVARQRHPGVHTLIDIGGEDAKMIFLPADGAPDIRMNGACAGGTGAFLDQMATLLDVSLGEMDALARRHSAVHPIASRCGVFAKTDVQNLLSRQVPREDIAASIFAAVALQCLASLSHGCAPEPKVLFAGGPLTFLPALRDALVTAMRLGADDLEPAERAELMSATGAALAARRDGAIDIGLSNLVRHLDRMRSDAQPRGRLAPLFAGADELRRWRRDRSRRRVDRVAAAAMEGRTCFLGIDSGSTTSKIVLIDEDGRLFFEVYRPNNGDAIQAVRDGLAQVRDLFAGMADPPRIARSAVTGYGEDLIRAAFGCDDGIVETIAHFRAARAFDPEVSFILDIGGQDMKAIFVERGQIRHIEINEACSSGCGTFVETFARSLGHDIAAFAEMACRADAPCDLGTRCTVFMNSKVKQSLREGASVADIAGGLAYAVIHNALHKVLKITDTSVLGDHIVVQGGAFLNPAIHRAFEQVLGRPVVRPDIAALMGAHGAALTARDAWHREGRGAGPGVEVAGAATAGAFRTQALRCRGCENQCSVHRLTFANGNTFVTGNRCERVFSANGRRGRRGANLFARKLELLFDRPTEPASAPRLTIGLPRALGFYDDYPFWCTLLVECGFRVRLSDPSSRARCQQGAASVMSENICFPAKLAHGHIHDLIASGVDRILFPMVFYAPREFADATNSYLCPIVSGYADVIRSAIDPEGTSGIPLDRPAITFHDRRLLAAGCRGYLAGLGVDRSTFERAFALALTAQQHYRSEVRRLGREVIEHARADGRALIVLAGHPYHVDPLVNHKIPELLAAMGVDVVTEDAVPLDPAQALDTTHVMTQWAFVNRCYHAARWVGGQPGAELAQLNSFGCGPDAFALDEVKDILREYGKNHTVIRIDEIDSIGSARLRLRSLLEASGAVAGRAGSARTPRGATRLFGKDDRRKTILAPEISPFCSPPILRPLRDMGYHVDLLPRSDRESVRIGLEYANNEICYPGIIVIGDAIKALRSGRHDPRDVVIGSWETGGQCRASNISCLLKKALVAAGFADVPVVVLSTSMQPVNPQPGMRINPLAYVHKAALGMVYTDALSSLYHTTAVRERHAGAAAAVAERHLARFADGTLPLARGAILAALGRAVAEFDAIPTHDGDCAPVGIVGEIYVKYNPFVNNEVARWLMEQGCEVVLPTFLNFFLGGLLGTGVAVREHLRRRSVRSLVSPTLLRYVLGLVDDAETLLRGHRHHRPRHAVPEIARSAQHVLSLTHQYGENWLLAGEVGEFVRSGVRNVLCLQPFGCVANHVVAKGVGRRLKATHRGLNLLFLDLDAGGSEANFVNRLHFFAEQARELEPVV